MAMFKFYQLNVKVALSVLDLGRKQILFIIIQFKKVLTRRTSYSVQAIFKKHTFFFKRSGFKISLVALNILFILGSKIKRRQYNIVVFFFIYLNINILKLLNKNILYDKTSIQIDHRKLIYL